MSWRFPVSGVKEMSGLTMADICAFDMAGWTLICPVCSHEYTHVQSAYTALGFDPIEGGVAYLGTEARGVTPYRRDCLVITIHGECDHAWEIRLQQHKGITYVMTHILADHDEKEAAREESAGKG